MQTRQLKVSSQPKPRKGYVPFIRLAGEWLRQAGIEIGQKVEIQVYEGRIEIILTYEVANEKERVSIDGNSLL